MLVVYRPERTKAAIAMILAAIVSAGFLAPKANAWSPDGSHWIGLDGAAGVAHGIFLLLDEEDAYFCEYLKSHPDARASLDETWRGAMNWVISQRKNQDGFAVWSMLEEGRELFQPGHQGIPITLVEAIRHSGDYRYRATLEDAMNFTKRIHKPVPSELQPCNTWPLWLNEEQCGSNYAHGVGGVIEVLLRVNDLTREAELERLAVGAANWLCHVAQDDGHDYTFPGVSNEGASWYLTLKYDDEFNIVEPLEAQCGICIGAAGNVRSLLQLYEKYKDDERPVFGVRDKKFSDLAKMYREYAERGLNWLTAVAEDDQGGKKWPYFHEPGNMYFAWYGKGASGIAATFAEAYRVTGCRAYAEHALAGARWLKAVAEKGEYTYGGETHSTLRWHADDKEKVSQCQGVDSVGVAFLELAELAQDKSIANNLLAPHAQDFLDCARAAAWWVASCAVADRGGYTWQFERPLDNGAPTHYATGFYTCGAAGTIDTMRKLGIGLGEPRFKELSLGAALWLSAVAEKTDQGYKWPSNVFKLEHADAQSQ